MISAHRDAQTVTASAPALLTLRCELAKATSTTGERVLEMLMIVQAVSMHATVELTWSDVPVPTASLPDVVREAVLAVVGKQSPHAETVPFTATVGTEIPDCLGRRAATRAAAVVAVSEALELQLDEQQLTTAAAELDPLAPLSMRGGTHSVRGSLEVGTGKLSDVVSTRVLARGDQWWAIALQRDSVSVADSVATLEELGRVKDASTEGLAVVDVVCARQLQQALIAGDVMRIGAQLHNDFDAAAATLVPKVRRVKSHANSGMNCAPAAGAVLCFNGPAIAFLGRDRDSAIDLAGELAVSGTCYGAVVAGSS